MSVKLLVLDFDGTLTSNHVWTDQNGIESVRSYRGDGVGIARLQALGLMVVILSSELNPVVQARAQKLGVEAYQTKAAKKEYLDYLLHSLAYFGANGWEWEDVAYMGNDVNDLECLKAVGCPGIPADAHPALRELGFWRSRHNGGDGAVREFCDAIADGTLPQPLEPRFFRRTWTGDSDTGITLEGLTTNFHP